VSFASSFDFASLEPEPEESSWRPDGEVLAKRREFEGDRDGKIWHSLRRVLWHPAFAYAIAALLAVVALRSYVSPPPGVQDPRTLAALGQLYRDVGAYNEAEPLYRLALAIRLQSLGPDHPDVAASLYDLGELYYSEGSDAQAERLYKRALAIQRAKLGPDDPASVRTLGALARVYNARSDYSRVLQIIGSQRN
jgi:tetratricopeptide (TPR) repeat protein